MIIANLGKQNYTYDTWYEFKKDLEKCLGHQLINPEWLEVKPRSPLPWNYQHMKHSYAQAILWESQAYLGSLCK